MQIASKQDNVVSTGYKIYTGVENFYVTAVNPTLKELNDMGIPATEEPVYHGTVEREYNGKKDNYPYFSLRIFLDNKDASNPIKTQVQYQVVKTHRFSTTGKYEVINKYGSTTWLEEEHITKGTLPTNMQWYVDEDIKKSYVGEEGVIKFIKALRNLSNITKTSTQDQKDSGIAMLNDADLEKMFKGDFKDIRNVLLTDAATSKVGLLLGVRKVEDKYRQTVYNRMPLRAYVKSTGKTEYLIKDVNDAQNNGAYSDVMFNLNNTEVAEFNSDIYESDDLPPEDDHDDLPF